MRKTILLAMATLLVNTQAFADDLEKTGVPECDNYLQKYVDCLKTKIPEEARMAFENGFKQTAAAIKQAAASSPDKTIVVATCTQALDAAKTSLGAFGCTW